MNLLAISGSTRQQSSNLNLIHAIGKLAAGQFSLNLLDGLTDIPHFNPDLDTENPPAAVAVFRKQVREADGVLICTPEYAIGVPGTLKNAIDWTVSSMEFSRKPVALITASTSGRKAHESLLGTLLIIEAAITVQTQLVVPAVRTKVNGQAEITDDVTLQQCLQLINSLKNMFSGEVPQELLPAPSLF